MSNAALKQWKSASLAGLLKKCIFSQSASLKIIERPNLSSRALTRDPEISN